MTGAPNPWDPPRSPRRRPPVGFFVWLVLLVATGLGIWQLAELLPGRASAAMDHAIVARNLILIAASSLGLVFIRRINIGRAARDIGIWFGIGAILLLGYSYKDDLRQIGARMLSSIIPGYAAPSGANESVLALATDGHFHILATVNGESIDFLIDTGASDIVLSPRDARRCGIETGSLAYSRVFETANGTVRGAPATLTSLRIGPLQISGMTVSVNQSDMRQSLLGMTFLRTMASFEIRGQNLFIRWR